VTTFSMDRSVSLSIYKNYGVSRHFRTTAANSPTAIRMLFGTLVSLLLVMSGCSARLDTLTIAGESSYEDGLQAFADKDYAEAVECFSRALERGALNADLMCDARLKRAQARVELEEFDAAHEDLEFLLEGAPDTTVILTTMAGMAIKQGMKDQARDYYQQARKINANVAIPPEFR
jgi:tetratricopeptide (TPR) repeat protein